MDRNQAIGLILISLLLIFYFQFFAPQPEPARQPQEQQEEITEESDPKKVPEEEDQQQVDAMQEVEDDTLKDSSLNAKFGKFAAAARGEKKEVTLENEDVAYTFDTQGGTLKKVHLKKYQTADDQDLILMNEESSEMSLVATTQGKKVDLYQLYYTVEEFELEDSTRVIFSIALSSNESVKHIYTIPKSGYQLLYKLEMGGLNDVLNEDDLIFLWNNRLRLLEKDVKESRIKATINYYTADEDFDDLGERSEDLEEEQLDEPLKWLAMKQHFFTSALIANSYFRNSTLRTSVDETDQSTVKVAFASLQIPAQEIKEGKASFKYYFGPNNYQILKKVTEGFSKNIYLGWPPVNLVNKWLIIPLFNWLENYVANYGIIIIILVLVIKLLLSPLSYKSYISMAKTKVLKPELDEIKKKHGDDMQKAQKEQMKLYQQVGVNPLSGCIPMLLQMPILFAMFYFFPNSIELRQESFLWADDLSTYDNILDLPFTIPLYGDHVSLFTLLMTLSTILYTWSNNQVSTVQGPMKSISYMMPVIFMFVLNSFPASLSFYYFVSNIITFGQQAIIRKFVDEEKIKKVLDENRLKNKSKKKSKFQLKLEEAMRAAEASKKKK